MTRATRTRMLQRRAFRAAGAVDDGPCTVPQFHAMVEYERLRADRSGSAFSLLVLTFVEAEDAAGEGAALAAILDRRLRVTDEIGWWDSRSLGVLLPETPAAGAWRVVGEISRLVEERTSLTCEVYVYPSHRPPPSDKEPSEPREEEPVGGAVPGREESASGSRFSRAARPMERLFSRAIPRWKRLMDILGAVVGLVLLSPVMLAAAVAVKLTSRGPLFFRQWRDGLGGTRFLMYKFRTMHVDAHVRKKELLPYSEQDGPAFKLSNDPRVTRVGRYLRCTCIDELPQLWHVLRGQMSLVGPRPLDSDEAKFCASWQRRRLDATPGLTCTWQVYGKSLVPFKQWMRMDIRYIASVSFWRDVRLILATVLATILHRGSN